MSAFMVSERHATTMVRAALDARYGFSWYHGDQRHDLNDGNCGEVATMLLQECAKSVGYRYPNEPTQLVTPVRFVHTHEEPEVAQVFKLIDCYEYQSCEHPEWEASSAYAFVQALRKAMGRRVMGYEEAEWAI